jgi:hypothetical protein
LGLTAQDDHIGEGDAADVLVFEDGEGVGVAGEGVLDFLGGLGAADAGYEFGGGASGWFGRRGGAAGGGDATFGGVKLVEGEEDAGEDGYA